MDLCRQPSARAANFFGSAMLDAGSVLMSPDNRTIDHLSIGIFSMRDGCQDPVPDTRASPTHEPVVADRVRSVSLRQVASRCSRPQYPKNAVQNPPIIHTRNPSGLPGEDRFDEAPLGVRKGVAHVDCSFPEFESRQVSLVQGLPLHQNPTTRSAGRPRWISMRNQA